MKDNSGYQQKLGLRLLAGLSVTLLASLGGCRGGNDPKTDKTSTVKESPEAPPQSPTVATLAPVGRADLLAAIAAAADSVAGGNPLPKANLELVDRTFELRLPFGCGGDDSADWASWSLDPKTRVLRISVRPQVWGDDPTIKALAASISYDAAEGFWIERPWTRSEQCPPPASSGPMPSGTMPARPAADQPDTLSPQAAPIRTIALVQYFSPDEPRNLQRGARPYSYTGKVPGTAAIGTSGFRLNLTGRLRGFGDRQPIQCVVTAASRPPICAAAVEFTQVVLEDANTGESLAEWSN